MVDIQLDRDVNGFGSSYTSFGILVQSLQGLSSANKSTNHRYVGGIYRGSSQLAKISHPVKPYLQFYIRLRERELMRSGTQPVENGNSCLCMSYHELLQDFQR